LNFMKLAKAMDLTKQMAIDLHTSIELSNLQPWGKMRLRGFTAPSITSITILNRPKTRPLWMSSRAVSAGPEGRGAVRLRLGQLVVKAFQKAGAVDREKFINAMEGLVVDSPVGKLEMRKCDHQLMLPMFFGVTKKGTRF